MRNRTKVGLLASSAIIALALSGCVTETVAPELHTSAFVTNEPDAPTIDEARSGASDSNGSSTAPVAMNASPPVGAVPAVAPPAPPIPALPPPPVLH